MVLITIVGFDQVNNAFASLWLPRPHCAASLSPVVIYSRHESYILFSIWSRKCKTRQSAIHSVDKSRYLTASAKSWHPTELSLPRWQQELRQSSLVVTSDDLWRTPHVAHSSRFAIPVYCRIALRRLHTWPTVVRWCYSTWLPPVNYRHKSSTI